MKSKIYSKTFSWCPTTVRLRTSMDFDKIIVRMRACRRHRTSYVGSEGPQYADFSLDQSQLGIEDFYDRMDDVMSPRHSIRRER